MIQTTCRQLVRNITGQFSSCPRLIRLLPKLLLLLTPLVFTGVTQAASKIYIKNETGVTLHVDSISVSGAPLSKKAWKAGTEVIPAGERVSILSINRTGKFNWMDPTPRYIEPGKTAFFTSKIVTADNTSPLVAGQKLTGTGSGSKMWHRVEGTKEQFDWILDEGELKASWMPAAELVFTVKFHLLKQGKDTHVEYIISTDEQATQ